MAFSKIIVNRYRMSGIEQFFRANGADVTRTSGNQNIHRLNLVAVNFGLNGKNVRNAFDDLLIGQRETLWMHCIPPSPLIPAAAAAASPLLFL